MILGNPDVGGVSGFEGGLPRRLDEVAAEDARSDSERRTARAANYDSVARETQMHFESAAVWRGNPSIGMHLRLASYRGE